jgi:hypothetical protein
MSTALTTFQDTINELGAAVGRLEEATTGQRISLMRVRLTAVQATFNAATAAARAVGDSGFRPTEAMQSQWNAVLLKMESEVRRATELLKVHDAQGASTSPMDAGFRIPGTQIVVPYIVLISLGLIGAAVWYVKKRTR